MTDCIIAKQTTEHLDEPEQYTAKDYLDALLLDDEAEVDIQNEPITLDAIVTKYLDRGELEELAVLAISGDYSSVEDIFKNAISEIMK